MSTFKVDINEISAVVKNQKPVSSELLEAYEGKPEQFDLLVKIIAEAQGADHDNAKFVEFVKKGETNWVNWTLVTKDFRNWLNSTHYNYECVTTQGLSELYLEWLELRWA